MKGRSPIVAGINLGHDAGAALLTETGMVAISEERLNRTRYSPGWEASLLYCLRAADITLQQIDLVVVSGLGRTPPSTRDAGLHHLTDVTLMPVDHHLAHAYTAYCLSSAPEATVLVVDGAGNGGDTETLYTATPEAIVRVGANPPDRPRAAGIGATYEAFTNWLGWHEQEAGKTMALAALGDPNAYPEPLFTVASTTVTGRLAFTHARGVADLAERTGWDFGPPGSLGTDPRGRDAAAYLQAHTEAALCHLVDAAVAATGLPDVCFAGGVALNCVAADRLRRLPSVRSYFAPPPASDRGQALGCALYGWHQITGQLPRRPLLTDSFGRTYNDQEIEQALRRDPRSGLVERRRTPFSWRRETDIARTAAQLIANGKLIGWFQGGSELGPRALGQRSILADPRTRTAADALNSRIKHRETFRPFAPAVLQADAARWFDLDVPSPFMLLAPPARPGKAAQIAGVLHTDGTARVQTVASGHALVGVLEAFDRITGVPVVLNTSFNDREPIVETPAHALATFQDTDLDALCIGPYLVEKEDI